MSFPLDQPVDLTFKTWEDDKRTTLEDPTALTITMKDPTGATTDHSWPGGDVVRTGLGVFTLTYLPAAGGGTYTGHPVATGAVTTSDDVTFYVNPHPLYLSAADLRIALSGSTITTGTAATLVDSDLNDAIWEAQTEVDGRLAGQRTVPFTQPPPLIINVTRDIAAYLATLTYRRGAPVPTGDPILLRYDRAQKILAGVASGAIALPTGGDPGADNPAVAQVAVANPVDGDLWGPCDFNLARQPAPSWPFGF